MAERSFNTLASVKVLTEGKFAGRLALLPDRLCVFEYSDEWLQSGFSLSPFYLPLRPGLHTAKRDPFDGLFGVFSDSLPDGWGTLLIDRWLRRQGIEPASLSVLDRLSLVGSNGMGTLAYEPDHGLKPVKVNPDLEKLALNVQRVLEEEERKTDLEKLIRMGESSGGARPKVIVRLEGKEWLVKFPASSDRKNSGEMEYTYSRVGRQCGLVIPETRLFAGKYFGVERFDRRGGRRIHMHSAAGLLNASFRYPSLDYTSLMKATMALTGDINECEQMFRLMVFNVLTGNRDDHAKNFSFLYDEERWKLSPAYDLVKSQGFSGNHSTTIAGNGNPSRGDIFQVAAASGILKSKATEIFEEVHSCCREIRIKPGL